MRCRCLPQWLRWLLGLVLRLWLCGVASARRRGRAKRLFVRAVATLSRLRYISATSAIYPRVRRPSKRPPAACPRRPGCRGPPSPVPAAPQTRRCRGPRNVSRIAQRHVSCNVSRNVPRNATFLVAACPATCHATCHAACRVASRRATCRALAGSQRAGACAVRAAVAPWRAALRRGATDRAALQCRNVELRCTRMQRADGPSQVFCSCSTPSRSYCVYAL